MVEDLTDSSEMVDAALVEDMNGIIPEEPQEFRHATSLDGALQHLIPTLQTNKGLTFTSLDRLSLRFSTPAVVARQHAVSKICKPRQATKRIYKLAEFLATFYIYNKNNRKSSTLFSFPNANLAEIGI